MVKLWPDNAKLKIILWAFLCFTVVVLIYAIWFRFYESPPLTEEYAKSVGLSGEFQPYRAYFDKENWFLYPVFVVIIGIVMRFTWEPFQIAWRKSASMNEPVLRQYSGEVIEQSNVRAIVRSLEKYRIIALFLALSVSAVWSAIDTSKTREAFFANSYLEQISAIIEDPDFSVKWLFERVPENQNVQLPAPISQSIFTILLEIEQLFLIALGFLVLFQISIQTISFAMLEYLNLGGISSKVHLNSDSKSHDFGLGHWNRALDLAYWVISLGLCIALVSRFSQPNLDKDIGILMGGWALGALLFTPLIVTILGRRRWLHECTERLDKAGADDSEWGSFHKQKLWPMDPKRFDKVGIAIAVALYSAFAGIEAAKYMKLLGV
ncbi:MAG: hypothetical protein JKY64_01980 [Alcanivorax sp.]|nr:hypothetical protein [Alcanivorax sp.]